MKRIAFVLVLCATSLLTIAADSIRIVSPLTRIVYQRGLDNQAQVFIEGVCDKSATHVEARLVARSSGQGVSTKWVRITDNIRDGKFAGVITAQAGWYDLEVCAKKKNKKLSTATRERVGIGDVFVVVGHSVAQGGDINIEGADDDRVSTVGVQVKSDSFDKKYLTTGDPRYLPEPGFVHASSGVALAPFGSNAYFWSKFAEYVVKKTNYPVLIYNAAFGGTSLEHWSKAARGIQFEHGFVRSGIRMPYINLLNTFRKYIPYTGIRAVLADHGQNDNGRKNADSVFVDYKIFVDQARKDLGYEELAFVINRQAPSNATHIRGVQERMLKEPNTFPGPDYDQELVKEDRYDGIHLSEQGLRKAAKLWADALTEQFFSTAKPLLKNTFK